MARHDDQGRRLCTASTKKGEPCRAAANLGATVCRMHGASAPQVEAKAARTLLEELVGPALMKLRELIEDPETPKPVLLGAIKDTLDRTGYKPILELRGMPTVAVLDEWIEELEAEQG